MAKKSKFVLQRLSSYSILKVMYTHDFELYTDCFVPIVLQAMSRRESATENDIHNELNGYFPLPTLLIQKILDRAVTKKYLKVQTQIIDGQAVDVFSLVEGYEKKLVCQPEDIKKRITEFVEDVNKYFREHHFIADRSVLSIVESFIDEEVFLTNFLKIPHLRDVEFPIARNDMTQLLRYLRKREEEHSKHVQTFIEIVKGSIIASALDWTDIDSIDVRSFKNCKIFIDTNTMFSILGMHGEKIEEAMCDLLEKLKFFDFKVYVFDFTVQQIRLVLDTYNPDYTTEKKKDNYEDIDFYRQPSVFKTLSDLKWNKEDISKYKDELDNIIAEKSISIVNTKLELHRGNISKYSELEALCVNYSIEFSNRKRKYAFDSNAFGKFHDFAAIYCITQYRNYEPVTLNNPKAIFLTSDRQLTRFNQIDMIHGEYELPEVILDTGIAAMLWFLYKGRGDINFYIELMISAYTRNQFISEDAWKQYQKVLIDMIEKEDIDLLQLPNFYFKNLHRDLCEIPVEKVSSTINTDFIIQGIQKAQEEEEKLKKQLMKIEEEKESVQKKVYTIHEDVSNLSSQINTIIKSKTKWKLGFFSLLFILILILLILLLK